MKRTLLSLNRSWIDERILAQVETEWMKERYLNRSWTGGMSLY